MSKKKQTELEVLAQEVNDFLAKILFAALLTGIGSAIFLKSKYAEAYPAVVDYAIEGRRLGFAIAAGIIIFYFLWVKRGAILESLVTFLNWIFQSIINLVKASWRSYLIGNKTKLNKKHENKSDNTEEEQHKFKPPDGYPGYHLLPAQAKTDYAKEGEKIAKELTRGLERLGLAAEIIQGIQVVNINNGPASAAIELTLPDGFTQSKMRNLAGDLKSALSLPSLEVIEGSAPGQTGIIIGHENRAPVYLRTLLESKEYQKAKKQMRLPLPIGIDMKGNLVFEDLTRFPHALVAGATSSGKSVWLTQAIITLVTSFSPKELNLLLIDPKKIEFSIFEDLPHVVEIETDAERAVQLLENLVTEMDRRFALFQQKRVKNLAGYNEKVKEKLPMIVCIVDEFNDLMVVAGKKTLEPIFVRIAQLARAAGIHLIIATQRPSVDVITGVIKGNLPTRICFSLTTPADYVTVFGTDAGGGFQLRGLGDGVARIEGRLDGFLRFQGATTSIDDVETEKAVEKLTEFWLSSSVAKAASSPMEFQSQIFDTTERQIETFTPVLEDDAIIILHDEEEPEKEDSNNTSSIDELEYLVALQIIDVIENTAEEKDILVSANRIRSQLKKNQRDIQATFDSFSAKEWVTPEPGKGYKILNEEAFYRLCDLYEQAV